MELTREQQRQFAKEFVPLLERTTDPEALEQLHKIAALVLEWSGFKDNGMAFSVSEYSFELTEVAKGKKDTGWIEQSRQAIQQELND